MPKQVELQIPASQVKVGDKIAGRVVNQVDVRTKWTVILLDKSSTDRNSVIRVENDDIRVVTREVPTDEEIAEKQAEAKAQTEAWMTERVLKAIVSSYADVDEALAKLAASVNHRHDSQHWNVKRYLEATAVRDIWATVAARMGKRVENGELVDVETFRSTAEDWTPPTVLEALAEEQEERKKALIEDSYRANSTDGTSNLCNDIMRERVSFWLRFGGWYGGA